VRPGQTPRVTELDEPLARARRFAAEDRLDEAAEAYRAARHEAPAEAAEFLGLYAVRRQRWTEARSVLEQAAQLAPDRVDVLEGLALACERTGAYAPARAALERVLAADPQRHAARLLLGFVEYREGHPLTAVAHMHWAFQQARQHGLWLDVATTPPWLNDPVRGAAAFMSQFPLDHVRTALAGAGGDLGRVDAFIRSQLGPDKARSPDPRQAPKKHYMPGLPPTPWFDTALFPWARRLQEAFPDILAEYLAVAGTAGSFEPFLAFQSAEQASRYLATTGPAPEWNGFFFYRHGERNEENCRRCPRTAALLEELPLVRLPGAAPEILFSVLTPGSHILPHRGDSNLRSVVHLGLVIPPDCILKVAGEERAWQPGGLLAFDDTFEHEAWNRSGSVRAVLLMDAWNPHLTDAERSVLPRVIGAMNDLGTELERVKPAVP
jgi:aspartate beta-hydroxylase